MDATSTTEQRLDRLEKLIDRVFDLARRYPLGRRILEALEAGDEHR